MQQYYTALENNNGRYTGVVFNSSNNSVEFRSKSHSSQIQAMFEVQNYLKTKQTEQTNSSPQVITNSINYTTSVPAPRRCCGR